MDRRKFLLSGIKVIPLGVGFTLMPSYTKAENLLSFIEESQQEYTFNAWEETFQKRVKDKQLDGAVISKIREIRPNFNERFTTDIHTKRVANKVRYNPALSKKYSNLSPITPHFKAVTNNSHDIEGQSFYNTIREKTGIFKGVRRTMNDRLDFSRNS